MGKWKRTLALTLAVSTLLSSVPMQTQAQEFSSKSQMPQSVAAEPEVDKTKEPTQEMQDKITNETMDNSSSQSNGSEEGKVNENTVEEDKNTEAEIPPVVNPEDIVKPEESVKPEEKPAADKLEKPTEDIVQKEATTTLYDTLLDKKLTFDQVMTTLYKEKIPLESLMKVEDSIRNLYFEQLSEKELYQFTELYKYMIISFTIENHVSEPKFSQEEVSGMVEQYFSLVELRNRNQWSKDEAIYLEWSTEAFNLITSVTKDFTYVSKEQLEKKVVDFTTYYEYLQSITDINIEQYFNLTGVINTEKEEEKLLKAKTNFKNFFYSIYGYEESLSSIITGFDKFDMSKNLPYTTITLEDANRADAFKQLPTEISVNLGDDRAVKTIPAEWVCEEDILTSKLNTYTFTLKLPEEYKIAKSLQKSIEDKKTFLPTVEVKVNLSKARKATPRGAFKNVTVMPSGMNGGTESHYWWVFIKVDSPSMTPVVSYRPSSSGTATNKAMSAGSWTYNGITYNYACPMNVRDNYYGDYVYNVNVENSMIGARTFTMGSMRIDSTYYWDLHAAVNAAYSGAYVYAVQNSTVNGTVNVNYKNIRILPDGGKNITITHNSGNNVNGMFCVGSTITLGGGSGTISFNGNRMQVGDDTGIINLAGGGSLAMESNARVYNSGGNGIISNENTSLTFESGALLYNNGASAVASVGNVNIKGGNFYNNGQDGVTMMQANSTSLSVTGGAFYGNERAGIAFGGLLSYYSGKTYNATLSGGNNYNNKVGLYLTTNTQNYWRVNANGMQIYSNNGGMSGKGGGAFINPRCTLLLNGSTIHSNSATNGGGIYVNSGALEIGSGTIRNNNATGSGGGVYNAGTFSMAGGTIGSNTAKGGHGGGIFSSGNINITGGAISNNTTTEYGGGIFINSGTVNQITAAIQNNTANGFGGGIFTNISVSLKNTTITGNKAVNNSGGGVYINYQTLNINNCNISENYAGDVGGAVVTYQGTINYNSGSMNSNSATTHGGAVYVGGEGATFIINGGEIAWNRSINYYGGAIFSNSNASTNIRGGSIYNNTSSHGGAIFNNVNSTLNVTNGSIYNNAANYGGAIFNQSNATFNLTGGTTYGNTANNAGGGVYNENTGVMNSFGGDISSNISPTGSCIFQNGTLNLNGASWFNNNNSIYLPDGKLINVKTVLTGSSPIALIRPSDYPLGRPVVRVDYGANGSAVYQKFALEPYSDCVLRPGDYEEASANTLKTDVVISMPYTITYDGNGISLGSVSNVPTATTKYWYEAASLSSTKPSIGTTEFKGWSEDKTAEEATYQPGAKISENRNMTLYAVWESKIKVMYVGNNADSGTTKSEYVTKQECEENGGYTIKKNKGYTEFTRKSYAFAGWADDRSISSSSADADFPENKTNKISFEMLKQMSGSTPQASKARSAAGRAASEPTAIFYDVWDAAPAIKADGVQEFYEGTEVTKEMLLKNVKAIDLKDGDITKNLRITSIEYSAGKLVNGVKQSKTKVTWNDTMPNDYKLDTWFLQLDKNDSPVIHKITYAVTDSAGNETKLDWTLKVVYNEFPVITAEDRYFTLEEARNGIITEDLFKKDALESGKLKVTDKEEDQLYPGTITQKIELVNFHPEEFKEFKESGYVVLTYRVQDSMGPGGKGKETFCQFTVHIVKDGEVVEPDAAKYVRFIDEKNYERNLGVDSKSLSDTEREKLNQNGGLNVDSKWYQDSDYQTVISNMWKNGIPEETWIFSNEDVQKVKEFIDTHGIGNSQEGNALTQFVEKFAH